MSVPEILIKQYPNRFWGVAEIFKNGEKIATANRFYDVSNEWITIYETVGGSGTGYKAGNVATRIFIGDCEIKTEVIR